MSDLVPIKLKMKQDGTVVGYVESIDVSGMVVLANGPIAYLSPAARSDRLAQLGIAVSTAAPSSGITYEQWLAGTDGYWGWINDS